MKNHAESEQYKPGLERQDAVALRKRAAEDAVKDADFYAFSTRPRHEKNSRSNGLELVSELLSPKSERTGAGPQEGIDGLLIHSGGGRDRLVLSDELLEVSLAGEVEALTSEPIRIFHVQTLAPWVEQVLPGNA